MYQKPSVTETSLLLIWNAKQENEETRRANAQMIHIQAQNLKKMRQLCLLFTLWFF